MGKVVNEISIRETIADIALNAGYMIAKGEIEVSDSRTLVTNILNWAEEFEKVHEKTNWDAEDYITAVDEFAESKLKEWYGTNKHDSLS